MELYTLTEEKERALWEDAIFIFDTSSILEIYSCVNNAQHTIMGILEHFKDRIWIPAQVKYEYMKHRDEILLKPIGEKYQSPKGIDLDLIKNIDFFLDSTNNEYFHPYIEPAASEEIEKLKIELRERIDQVIKIQKKQYEKRKQEIKVVQNNDVINKTFMALKCGEHLNYDEQLCIVKEGELRYRNCIPPGYMDGEKTGMRLYADLII